MEICETLFAYFTMLYLYICISGLWPEKSYIIIIIIIIIILL